jgi:hypothetical protein
MQDFKMHYGRDGTQKGEKGVADAKVPALRHFASYFEKNEIFTKKYAPKNGLRVRGAAIL